MNMGAGYEYLSVCELRLGGCKGLRTCIFGWVVSATVLMG